jgi:hypothetical protein
VAKMFLVEKTEFAIAWDVSADVKVNSNTNKARLGVKADRKCLGKKNLNMTTKQNKNTKGMFIDQPLTACNPMYGVQATNKHKMSASCITIIIAIHDKSIGDTPFT